MFVSVHTFVIYFTSVNYLFFFLLQKQRFWCGVGAKSTQRNAVGK